MADPKITQAQISQAIKALSNPNSYSSIYRNLTSPREYAQPQGAVDLGTVAEIRQLASEEEQPQAIELPSLASTGTGGGYVPPPPPASKPKAAPSHRQPSLDEQARMLQEQLGQQYAAYDAAGPAVNPDDDAYAYMGAGRR